MQLGELEAALVSITEVARGSGWAALDGVGIVSRGPVYSVFLAHHQPLERIETVHVDAASCTSVQLLRVLLAERGVYPAWVPLDDYAKADRLENVLLIGNPAIEFRRRRPTGHKIWDLGEAWQGLTGLPFVYAVWALRLRCVEPGESGQVRWDIARALLQAAGRGTSSLSELIERRTEFDLGFRRAYLGGHIQYEVDLAAKAGVDAFTRLRRKHVCRDAQSPDWIKLEDESSPGMSQEPIG